MGLKFNGTTPAKIIYDGNTISKVKYGDVTVWVAFESQDFEYTGNVQSWTAPVTGTYELEVWGAQGGNYTETKNNIATIKGYGGKGGYSKARFNLQENQTIYIVIGGHPADNSRTGGYNGGATSTISFATNVDCGGGGATHIAITNKGTDVSKGQLFNYENSASDDLLLVAGGGGGATFDSDGGIGGGSQGGNSESSDEGFYCGGGTQNGPGTSKVKTGFTFVVKNEVIDLKDNVFKGEFGKGGYNSLGITTGDGSACWTRGGGGGGYYGGSTYMYINAWNTNTNNNVGGGGGSGYINTSKIVTDNNKDSQNGVNEGNGKAKITLILD